MQPKSAAEQRSPSASLQWVAPLVMTLAVQCICSFLSRLPPTVAPILTEERGIAPATIGYLAAVSVVGSMLFLVAGSPLMDRAGSARTLQIGLVLGAVGCGLAMVPTETALLLSVLLIGLGYGPSSPAGSDILQRYSPPRHRSLIFSIKQAGVPAGGILAGILLPPAVAWHGLEGGILISVALTLAVVVLIQPLRRRVDPEGGSLRGLRLSEFLAPDNLTKPIRSLRTTRGLTKLALCGLCLAVSQGAWLAFLVTILVAKVGLTLVEAGWLFAVMQVCAVGGRVLLGWIADRTRAGTTTLRVVAVVSAVTSLALAFVTPDWSMTALTALCGVAGLTVMSWNGVQIAEVARLSPAGQVRDVAAGATLVLFIGYVLGPAGCALLIELTGGFEVPMLAMAAVTFASAAMTAGVRNA